MKKIFASAVLVIFGFTAMAQNNDAAATALLKKVQLKYEAFKTMKVDFNQKMQDNTGEVMVELKGVLYTQGDQFKLDMPEQSMMTDGKTFWMHYKEENEVMIDNFDASQDGMIKPSDIFSLYEKDYLYRLDQPEKIGSKQYEVVRFTPRDKASMIHTIKLYVSPSSSEIKKAVIIDKEQQQMHFSISGLVPNPNLGSGFFVFNTAKHPGVDVMDNR